MINTTPLSLYKCESATEFSEILQNEPKFNINLAPVGQLPLLVYLMLDQNKEKIQLFIEYGAELMSTDILALCEMQCNLNIFEYVLEKSQAKIDTDVILKIAENPQLTDFVALLAKFGNLDELEEIVFQLVNLDMPNETLEEVLTFCSKKGLKLKWIDQNGNNLLHLLYANKKFQMAQFVTKLVGEDALEQKNLQLFTPLDIKKEQEDIIEQEKQRKQEEIEEKRNKNLNKFVQRQQNKKAEDQQKQMKKEQEKKTAQKAEKQLAIIEKSAPYLVAVISVLVIILLYLLLQQNIQSKKSGNYID